jgi:hypothetical protein
MTVKELIEALSKLEQDKEVCLYNGEWETNDPLDHITEDTDSVTFF